MIDKVSSTSVCESTVISEIFRPSPLNDVPSRKPEFLVSIHLSWIGGAPPDLVPTILRMAFSIIQERPRTV